MHSDSPSRALSVIDISMITGIDDYILPVLVVRESALELLIVSLNPYLTASL